MTIVAFLLIGPRVEIVALGGSSIRLEDILVLSLVPAAWKGLTGDGNRGLKGAVAILGLSLAVAFSAGAASGRISIPVGALYAIRPLEYLVVLFALLRIAEIAPRGEFRLRGERLLSVVVVVQTVAAFCQIVLELDFGFSKFALTRGAGMTAGPYELGGMMAAGAIYFAARGRVVLTSVSIAGVLFSASRVSLLAVAIGLTYLAIRHFFSRRTRPSRLIPVPVVLATLGVMGLAAIGAVSGASGSVAAPVADRLSTVSIAETWTAARSSAKLISTPETSAQYFELAYLTIVPSAGSQQSYEASSYIRFLRWNLLLRTQEQRGAVLVGLGPSFAGASVDGAYLRMYIEGGLVVLAAWALFVRKIWKNVDVPAQCAVLTMLVGSIFIDLPYSLRMSVFMYLIVAIGYGRMSEVDLRGSD